MLASFTPRSEYMRGDVDQNGQVTIGDVTCLIDYLLNGTWGDEPATPYDEYQRGDVDQNGQVTIGDVTFLIDYLLSGEWPEENQPETETFTVNGVTFKMVFVEGGTFTMGNNDYNDEKPAHQVTLSNYSIGETEVTQELWVALMGSNPSQFTGMQRPLEQFDWEKMLSFISKLNELTGKNFRMPTEAEWEYAARGGNRSQGYLYAGSDNIDEVAWIWQNIPSQSSGNEGYGTQPVATKTPNELGLYDMSGNVTEYVSDFYGKYSNGAQTNPVGPVNGNMHAYRGGCWLSYPFLCRVSYRSHYVPYDNDDAGSFGFRLAFDDENSPKFRLSKTVVTVKAGESETVNILNGIGNYSVTDGTTFASSTISGNNLTVTGNRKGFSTVYVTDNSTGAITVLQVLVLKASS